ncbi:MAG: hypothetical protein K6A73_07660 [Bacteroidales bacterium]|nr:hypothetical protein [Bacteroidales bacterium]
MKRLLLIISAMIMLLFSGCKKSEDKQNFSLVGKTYAATQYFGSYGSIVDPYTAYYVIRFTSNSTIECSDRENGIHGPLLGTGRIVTGSYSLSYPNIHLEYDDPTLSTVHHSINAVFIDESCFRDSSTNREYVLQ